MARLDHLELLERLEQGDVIETYRARDVQNDRLVLVKRIRPDRMSDAGLVEQFRRAATPFLGLHLPHAAPVHAVHADQEACYLVTDPPAGESLAQRMARSGPLEVDDVLSVVTDIAEALDCAHKQGLLHLDIRPDNIYLVGNEARLTNWRVVEAVGAAPAYQPPEQLDPDRAAELGPPSDVYALGCVVYEMLTGRPPFEGTPEQVKLAQQTQRPSPPRIYNPDLLPALDAILLKALAKPLQARYKSAGELSAALHEAVQLARTRRMGEELAFGTLWPGDRATRPVSTSNWRAGLPLWVWVGIGLLGVVVAALLILLLTGGV